MDTIRKLVFPLAVAKDAAPAEVDDTEERTMRFVASDETVDRYGDVIVADGWQLSQFRKNPIFLWMHSYRDPIGLVPEVKVEGSRLMARVKFAAAGVSKVADDAWKLAKAGVLRAVSVGFTVASEKDYEYIRNDDEEITGLRFLRQELLELSLVSVPANPNALSVGRSLDITPDFLKSAVVLDASVLKQHREYRQRLMQTRLAGSRLYVPRSAVTQSPTGVLP